MMKQPFVSPNKFFPVQRLRLLFLVAQLLIRFTTVSGWHGPPILPPLVRHLPMISHKHVQQQPQQPPPLQQQRRQKPAKVQSILPTEVSIERRRAMSIILATPLIGHVLGSHPILASAAVEGYTAGSTTTPITTFLMSSSSPMTEDEMVAMKQAFDAVRQELYSPKGGVAYMQSCIDQGDFQSLLEFTKSYDQILRKGTIGKAKKFLTTTAQKEIATAAANGVTFDLIGINRNSRPGKEDITEANKYLQELREDVQKFLDLQPET